MKYSDLTILKTLKEDIFGTITLAQVDGAEVICRSYFKARNMLARYVAYFLARRESRILKRLESIPGDKVPKFVHFGNGICVRSSIDGKSLRDQPASCEKFYAQAYEILNQMHSQGVVHNDLEKPENWLVTKDNGAAIVDFQLAVHFASMSKLFHLARREDIRHLVKNKERFYPEGLTDAERIILKKPKIARANMKYLKPIYNFITRKILNYSDRKHSKYSR